MRYPRLLVLMALVGALGAACGGGGDGGDGGTTTKTLTMVDNAFQPTDPVVSSGASLALVNEGAATHTFTVGTEGIDEQVVAGAESSVTISLEPGTYDFDCSFHPEMTGTLTVQ
jgi:plastocyanin